jgi:hypothetical protein
MRRAVLVLVAVALSLTGVQPALAIMQFNKVFIDEYIKDHQDKEFAEYVEKKVKCFVCHQGKKKSNHNPYGEQLHKLLDKKEDKDNVEKIRAALENVGKMHSDPKDPKSPTYAELIAAGKLPGGSLEDSQKEPAEGGEAE